MTTPLRSASPRSARKARPCNAPSPAPAACGVSPPAPVSERRLRAPRAVKAAPPVVVPPAVEVHVLAYGRSYVTFSGVVGAPSCRVTTHPSGYVRLMSAPDARALYADYKRRGYVVPSSLYSAA